MTRIISARAGAPIRLRNCRRRWRELPEFGDVKPLGAGIQITDRRMARLLRPIETYLPFINGNLRYDNTRLKQQLGCGDPPSARSYVPELIGLISLDEALMEMYKP